MERAKAIAEAFVNKRPYYDGEFIVVHESTEDYTKSAIGVYVATAIDIIKMRPVLYMRQNHYPNAEYSVEVVIDHGHVDPSKIIRIFNAVFERIKSTIGVEIRAVDAGGAVGIAIKGYKYLFREHDRLTSIVKRNGVRIMGYFKRFAPFTVCRECIEVADRIMEIQSELKEKSDDLDHIWYRHHDTLCRLGINTVKVRKIARMGLRMAESNVVVDGVGVYLGYDSPRALLSRYEKINREVSELLDEIKFRLALNKLLS
jgi:hypothetical protein